MVHCYHGAWSLQTWSAYLKEIPDNVYRRSPNTVFAVACLTAFLDSFNVGTVIIALPIIKDGLQIHLAYLQWISVAYTLTVSISSRPKSISNIEHSLAVCSF